MTSPTQTEPPTAALRRGGGATRRTPLRVFAVLAAAVGVLLVSLAHTPSKPQRAGDLAGYFGDVKAGIGSCAAGLHDSENAYAQVLGGRTAQADAAESVFRYGGSNCTLANNQALAGYQVTESLSSLHLDTADSDVITWSFDSTAVQQDMLAVLRATTLAARTSVQADLKIDLAALGKQRAAIDAIWAAAKHATGATAAFPSLPAWEPSPA